MTRYETASLILSRNFADKTKRLPQVPIAPGVGAEAMRLMDSGMLAPAQFAAWPNHLQPRDFAAMYEALDYEHAIRGLPGVPQESLRRAAGFVVTAQLTAITELFRGDNGVELPNIPKLPLNDQAVETAAQHLADPYRRSVALAVFETAAAVIDGPTLDAPTGIYRSAITGISRAHGSVGPEDPAAFAAKQAELDGQRAEIAGVVGGAVLEGLHVAELGGQFHLSDHQLTVVAHNLTRWQPAPEWFAPAA
ncbi:MAG TPA: hypothetical protein VF466_03670 [Candidatus Saccharimonadales bacterium]